MIVIHEMTLLDLVVGHLYTTAQFWQYHHFDIFVLKPHGLVFLINLLIADTLDDRIRIDHAT